MIKKMPLVFLCFMLFLSIPGCKKKLPTQPDIPTKILPTITSFTANPTSITLGESSTLSWSTTNATAISINQGVGNVSATGTVEVSPGLGTTTFTLTATNSDGSKTRSCTVHAIPNYEGDWSGFYIISGCEATGDFEGGCELFPPSSYQLYIELFLEQIQDQVIGYFFLGDLFADAEGSIAENGQLLLTGLITEEGSPITINVEMQLQSTIPGQITGELSQLWLGEGVSGHIQLSCNIVTLNRTSTMMTAVTPSAPRMQSPTLEDLIRALMRR